MNCDTSTVSRKRHTWSTALEGWQLLKQESGAGGPRGSSTVASGRGVADTNSSTRFAFAGDAPAGLACGDAGNERLKPFSALSIFAMGN